MTPIIMPQVGQDIPAGKIVQWLKRENGPVQKGEVVLIVESEKATFEVEAEQSGVLLRILVPEGQEAPVLAPVGYIGQPGEAIDQGAPPRVKAPAPPPATQASAPPEDARPKKQQASPSARRIAGERGLDLAMVQGTGPGGRVIKRDLVAERGATEEVGLPQDTIVPFSRTRKAVAERLTASKRDIPHFCLFVDVDMSDAAEWRKAQKARSVDHATITDLVIKAAAMALAVHPRLNAHVGADRIVLKKAVNIGVAVAVEEGLLVPVIPEADRRSLHEISELARKNAEAARRGVLPATAQGTFTITSLGMHGVRQFIPIINPPECAILAVGSIEGRVVPVPGGIGIRQMMTLTLACDHRVVDGADAAGLLNDIKRNLETTSQWAPHEATKA